LIFKRVMHKKQSYMLE